MSHPRIELLGGFRLIVDGRPISLSSSQKAVVLFAYLACRCGRETPREVLIEALWPGSDPDSGRTRLRTVLSDLRKMLADQSLPETEILAASRGGVALDSNLVTTDVCEFEGLTKSGRDLKAERILRLESALNLYKGELLPGFYDEWAQVRREMLAKSRVAAVSELAALYESEGKPDRAAGALLPLVKEDPLNEDAHCEIMRLQIAGDMPSAALRQFADLSRSLKDELDVEPSSRAQILAAAARTLSSRESEAPAAGVTPAIRPRSVCGAPTSPPNGHSTSAIPPRSTAITFRKMRVMAAIGLCAIVLGTVANTQLRNRNPDVPPRAASPAPQTLHKEPEWVYQFEPDAGDKGSDSRAIVADALGYSYIAGFVDTDDNDVDFLVIKLDRNGMPAWEKPFRYNGPGDNVDRAYCIALDLYGNIYVTGDSDNGTRGDEWTRLAGTDFATIKIGPDGKPSRSWPDVGHGVGVRRYNGPDNGEEMPIRLLVDKLGGVYVLGHSFSRKGSRDWAVVKYDQNGRRVWADRVDGPAHDEDFAADMFLDSWGNLFVTGTVRSIPKGSPETDISIVKYRASDGMKLWQTTWGQGNHADDAGRLVSADAGSVYVIGMGKTGPGTYNNKHGGMLILTLDGASGKLRRARGAVTDADHLDTHSVSWGSFHVGSSLGQSRVVFAAPGGLSHRTMVYNSTLSPSAIFQGEQFIYVVGTCIVPQSPGRVDVPRIVTLTLNVKPEVVEEWIFPGPGGAPHSSRAACMWLEPDGVGFVRQHPVIAGQYFTGDSHHIVALSYDSGVRARVP